MLTTKKSSRRGFTITEILIAVLLVLILSAIAVPRLLGNQRQAEDTAAKAQLRTAAEVARNLMYENGNRFTADTDAPAGSTTANPVAPNTRLSKDEPNIQFVPAPTPAEQDPDTNRRSVSVYRIGQTEWIAAALGGSSDGQYNCWFIKISTSAGDQFALTTSSTPSCAANSAVSKWEDYEFPPAV